MIVCKEAIKRSSAGSILVPLIDKFNEGQEKGSSFHSLSVSVRIAATRGRWRLS